VAVGRALRALLDGRFAAAKRLIDEALALGQRLRHWEPAADGAIQLFFLRREQGRCTDEEDALRAAVERYPGVSAPWWLVVLDWELGRTGEARAAVERVAADGFTALPRDQFWLFTVCLLAEVSAALPGLEQQATTLYGVLLPYAGRNVVSPGVVVCIGATDRYLGLLAAALSRWDAAAGHFENALAMHERMSARPWVAHTQHDYAVMLLARHRAACPPGRPTCAHRDQARALLRAALHTACELGMAHLVEQINRVPANVSLDAAFPDGLTGREVEVLRLLTRGQTSREIAAELVVSTHTVTRHIANIYAKINAHGRAEAAAYSLRHRLLSADDQT
jgi:DNA-binding CsgD family transcriptional regulator